MRFGGFVGVIIVLQKLVETVQNRLCCPLAHLDLLQHWTLFKAAPVKPRLMTMPWRRAETRKMFLASLGRRTLKVR